MREIPFTLRFGVFPDFYDVFLQPSESFFFRDTGISYTVKPFFQKIPFFLRRKVSVIRHSLVTVSYTHLTLPTKRIV